MKLYKKIFIVCLSLFLTGNFVMAAELVPNDPGYNKQWYLDKLNMPQVWAEEAGSKKIIIAVIDSGVDTDHPDLHGNIWVNNDEILGDNIDNDQNGYIDDINGWDFIEESNDPAPKYNPNCFRRQTCLEEAILHGTFVAGVAAAVTNNGMGGAGIGWHTKIMPLRVLNQNGSGNTLDVIQAINYAIDNQADIINLSFVGESYDPALEAALNKAYQAGLLIVVAAGNEDFTGEVVDLDIEKMFPVCHQGLNGEDILIGVGASDKNNKLAGYSNYGSSCVDIIAPGDNFWGVLFQDSEVDNLKNYYGSGFSGTSLATPIISGLAALIKAYKPSLNNQQITDLLLNNTDNIDDINPDFSGKLGHGLVNPVKVWQNLVDYSNKSRLIKASNSSTIYYQAINGKRYVFPDAETYFSWYDDFNKLITISARELSQIPLAGNVTVRPGTRLIKIQSDPKVYAVSQGGVLRWVKNEELARGLYGSNWQDQVIDISVAFFINYQIGQPIEKLKDFDPFLEKNTVVAIDQNKGLFTN
jgi:hypothetical protein